MKVGAKFPDGKETIHFDEGEIIFQQGDPGGDLYFIKAGAVEIFTEREGHHVTLSVMKTGEIIGVLTCLTSNPRMASAKAVAAVVVDKVPHASIAAQIKAMPAFMKIVLKEFSGRLQEANSSVAKSSLEIKKAAVNQVTPLYTATQMAGAMHTLGEMMAVEIAEKKYVIIEDLLTKVETAIGAKREELDRLFEIFLQAGVFKIDIEPDRKRKALTWDLIQRLPAFVQFVNETRHAPKRNILKVRFFEKERATLLGLAQYAKSKGLKLGEMNRVPFKELEADFKKITGVEFEPESLTKGRDAGLVAIEGQGDAMKVAFSPTSVSRTLAFILAVQKLRG